MTTVPTTKLVALPTGLLIWAAWAACALAGGAWGLVAFALGQRGPVAFTGPAAAGVVAVAATVALLVIRPWRPKPAFTWANVWMAGSFLRLVITLAGVFLLYSATPLRGRNVWFAAVLAYVAVMVCETRIFAGSMKRLAPPDLTRILDKDGDGRA